MELTKSVPFYVMVPLAILPLPACESEKCLCTWSFRSVCKRILAGYCKLHTLIPAFFSLPFEATLCLLSSSKLHLYFPPSLRSWLLPSPHSQSCFGGCLCAGHLNSSLNLCSYWAIKVRLWGFHQRWAAAVLRRHKPSFVSCKETNLSAQDTEAERCPELKSLIFKKQQTVVCS